MKTRICTFLVVIFLHTAVSAQDFPFGASIAELTMTEYPPDTSAGALVIKEFGEAYISNG